ncbi:MAG: deoxyribose-phosphate aldolase [Candidatus Zixiibacteriota bacterium]|nr:MAG: deoxyribose-phosphate aldolase [candidate division Zixibacteria bacterium]
MSDILTNLNRKFDHATLHSEVTEKDIIKCCKEAIEYNFYSVAINPVWVKVAANFLSTSDVKILSVSGFPLGAARTDVKVIEAIKGVDDGAHEIDMVANIGWLASDRYSEVEREIEIIRENLPFNVLLKVIIEAGKLNIEQQIEATKCVMNGGAQFVKTCTGFFGGATIEQVNVLKSIAKDKIKVKASGGIRTLKQCKELIEAGANRLGSSSSVSIMHELNSEN